jgi:tRNA(fMet)-specific endonuclease VapC
MEKPLLYDTGILIYIVRDTSIDENVRKMINPNGLEEFISVVNKAEALSIANRNAWGKAKILKLNRLFHGITIVDISDDLIIDRYVDIDVFSQKQRGSRKEDSPRNMGKNDLWIAATSSSLEFKLITTDKDYDHLQDEYLERSYFSPESFR